MVPGHVDFGVVARDDTEPFPTSRAAGGLEGEDGGDQLGAALRAAAHAA
jgi:hypothetical protein